MWLSEKFEMVKFTLSLVKKRKERRGEKKGREKEKKNQWETHVKSGPVTTSYFGQILEPL